MKKLKLFINNQWVDASDGKTFKTFDPSKNEVITELALASDKDVDDAVKAARNAFNGGWSELDADERANYLVKAANIMRRRKSELAEWEARDVGKPIFETKQIDIDMAIRALEYFANLAREIRGQVIPLHGKDFFDYVTYEPYGVVATIVPWNFPLHIATRSISPALAVGNTVVLKASSLAPITCTLLGEIFKEVGLPAGVFNVVSGTGSITGEALLKHDDINLISFTGSVETGRRVIKASAEGNLKKVILELGGKGPFIAEPDCDINGAVNTLIIGFNLVTGEVCCASTRLYLHEDIYDEFMELLLRRVNSLKMGDTLDPETQIGALISKEHLQKVDGFVQEAIANGARLITGGEQCITPPCDKGNFYKPTILEVDSNSMRCVQEEIFGPVLVVLKYRNLDDAIKKANDSKYALGATIWSENVRTLYWAARKLNAGIVWMNTNEGSKIEAPYGGNKNSGIGREDGIVGLMEYLRVKNNVLYVGKEYENFYGFTK